MLILKDPAQAQSLGLISTKARLTAGTADWPAYFGLLAQAVAAGGSVLFALITTWVFGREFADRTAKELLAVPTPRWATVAAKLTVVALWSLALAVLVFVVGLAVGAAVNIPGWSPELALGALRGVLVASVLAILLLPWVALFASFGRGYLPPMGWTLLMLALANLAVVLGWGDWFPWAVPILASGAGGPTATVGPHSYLVVLIAGAIGLAATVAWWRDADQAR